MTTLPDTDPAELDLQWELDTQAFSEYFEGHPAEMGEPVTLGEGNFRFWSDCSTLYLWTEHQAGKWLVFAAYQFVARGTLYTP